MKNNVQVLDLEALPELAPMGSKFSIALTDHLPSVKVINLCLQNDYKHVVQKSNVHGPAAIELSALMISDPRKFLSHPLSLILGSPDPTDETEQKLADLSYVLSEPGEKIEVLNQLEIYLGQFSKSISLSNDIRLVADELITNSIYNAPFVDMDNTKPGAQRESTTVTIDPTKKPRFFAGHNNDNIVIGCTDYYGRLNITRLMERIQRCYLTGPSDNINFGPGGAGIGAFMIFDSCVSFYVAVDAGRTTTVSCTFPLKMSARKRQSVPKNIHIIFTEPQL